MTAVWLSTHAHAAGNFGESFMEISRRAAVGGGASLLAAASLFGAPGRAYDGPIADPVEGGEDFALALEAYAFAYPLVTMELTRRVFTNVARVEGTRGPMGHIIPLREYPTAAFRDVTAPNADTLYTTAFFDVGKEPWVLGIPAMETTATPSSRCSTAGQTCSRSPASAPLAPPPKPMPSPGRGGGHAAGGRGRIQDRPLAWSGCSAASTAPARPRTMLRCTRCRTSSSWRPSAPGAPTGCRRPGRSTQRST